MRAFEVRHILILVFALLVALGMWVAGGFAAFLLLAGR